MRSFSKFRMSLHAFTPTVSKLRQRLFKRKLWFSINASSKLFRKFSNYCSSTHRDLTPEGRSTTKHQDQQAKSPSVRLIHLNAKPIPPNNQRMISGLSRSTLFMTHLESSPANPSLRQMQTIGSPTTTQAITTPTTKDAQFRSPLSTPDRSHLH